MKKQFVTYKEALALQKLGFNETCLAVFINQNFNLIVVNRYLGPNVVLAPLYQQAFVWLSKQLGINLCMVLNVKQKKVALNYHIKKLKLKTNE